MARRASPKEAKAPPAATPAEDLAILHPNRELAIGGELVTVKEYGFALGLRLQGALVPLVNALAELVEGGKITNYDSVRIAFSDHADEVVIAVAASIDQSPAWVSVLTDSDGELLLDTWWAVNQPFFLRRVRTTLGIRMATRSQELRRAALETAGPTPTPS